MTLNKQAEEFLTYLCGGYGIEESQKLQELIQSAILAEREACAKIAESLGQTSWPGTIAEAIRARSNAPEVKCSRGAYGDYDTLPSLIPETEKEITAQTPPKSRQAGVFTPNPVQIIDSKEIVAPSPVSA